MNNISFIKRIDDLGRIVIPKDIRKTLGIENNESMEIISNNNEIIIKKHDKLEKKEDLIIKLGKVIYNLINKNIIITNREKIIYSNKNEILNKKISNYFKKYIVNREEIEGYNELKITDDDIIKSNIISKNIIIDSDACGIIIIYDENLNEKDKLILDIFFSYISSL